MAAFDGWAAYYDLFHTGVSGEAEFYVGQAVRLAGSTLELGCGTGRLAIPMAMSGVDVIGLDNSRPMLDRCRAKLHAVAPIPGRLSLIQADMADFDLATRFDFIAMAYRTFMHLLIRDDQLRCLETVRRHLREGGVFIMNAWAAPSTTLAVSMAGNEDGPQFVGAVRDPDTERLVRHYAATHFDDATQTFSEEHILQELDDEGAVVNSCRLPMARAWTTPSQMEALFQESGFAIEAVFGDFDCGVLAHDSTEMIWVVRG